jgi:hypothetical protein
VLARTINGYPAGDLTRDDVLDDLTLYGGICSAHFHWENKLNYYNAVDIDIPAVVRVFSAENYSAPWSCTERAL